MATPETPTWSETPPTEGKKPAKRGTCPVCGYRYPLITDGLIGLHWTYYGSQRLKCRGSYTPPREPGA